MNHFSVVRDSSDNEKALKDKPYFNLELCKHTHIYSISIYTHAGTMSSP